MSKFRIIFLSVLIFFIVGFLAVIFWMASIALEQGAFEWWPWLLGAAAGLAFALIPFLLVKRKAEKRKED